MRTRGQRGDEGRKRGRNRSLNRDWNQDGHQGGRRAGRTVASVIPLLALALAGCGIRATSVPTDFGPAPSRASCRAYGANVEAGPAQGIPVQIFLVCASQLVTTGRTVRLPAGNTDDPVQVARALLDQLQTRPATPEKQAGYSTGVLGGMKVTGGHAGDPRDTLRLSIPPRELATYALAQIVCTFANSAAAADDGSVILGGPDSAPLLRYHCTPEVRSRPSTTAPPTSPVETS